MSHAQLPLAEPRPLGATMRRDSWWLQSAVTFLVFSGFIVYSTWAAFQNAHYESGPYLSPFYSPLLFGDSHHALLGVSPPWWPPILPYSAAFLILWAPGGFRFTCYYYRGAYYKAFWADPPACAVGEPGFRGDNFRGEKKFPLIFQNVHRYFMYLALVFLVFLAWDVWKATQFTNPQTGQTTFGIGVGTLVLALNVTLLAGYTFGCHSLRHVIGGYLDRLARRPVRSAMYHAACKFNRAHMKWAWMSLFGVAFADVYVRLCSMGIWTDWRLL
ncbi:MAG TPA: hypothetical protein VJR92_02330 [Gemmatimonadaceae bacterium]|nr:hypothetical protein [Gemmatimonadaceae bacterium]